MKQLINYLINKLLTLKKMDELIQLKAQAFDAITSRDQLAQQLTGMQNQLSVLDANIVDFKNKISNYNVNTVQQ